MFAVSKYKTEEKATAFDLKRMKSALSSQERKAKAAMTKEEKRAFLSGKL